MGIIGSSEFHAAREFRIPRVTMWSDKFAARCSFSLLPLCVLRKNAGGGFFLFYSTKACANLPRPVPPPPLLLLFVRPTTGRNFLSSFSVNCVNKYLPPSSPPSSILFFKWFPFFLPLSLFLFFYIYCKSRMYRHDGLCVCVPVRAGECVCGETACSRCERRLLACRIHRSRHHRFRH
jgi:hypothetical protein